MTQYEKVTGTPFVGECKNATFNLPLEFDPGERWQYGINIDWVGKAVEAVSDQSLEIYFRENIFAPFGHDRHWLPHQLRAKGPVSRRCRSASRTGR